MTDKVSKRFVSRLTRRTLALILAGGRGERLKDLTRWRAKPAVPFGGKFRIIDFPLSNCVNSGIRRISVLTQYKAHSLIQHVQRGWGFLQHELNEFVEIMPASQRVDEGWYAGTADAIYQNLDIVRTHKPHHVLVLAGDHVYKMDYGPMLAFHAEHKAEVTIGCVEVPIAEAIAFGVMAVDENWRVTAFDEKPERPCCLPGREDTALVSMGIYIFNTAFFYRQLIRDADTLTSGHDFGKDVIPSVVGKHDVYAYPFQRGPHGEKSYWRDVGSIDSYWLANMELVAVTPELNLYDTDWPIRTYQEQLPPAKFVFDDDDRRGMAVDSMVSGGCIISGSLLRRSLLFSSVEVAERSRVEDSVVLPNARIGPDCTIRRAIIDKGCSIPAGTTIGLDPEADRLRFHVSPAGVVLVTPEMLGQDLHHIR
jgi:glucose-1-phosphate adenylyltransferase